MLTVRRAHERGHADHGWLDSHHTFSFADYYDPSHMGFRALRVINEDRVAPGAGFGSHPHRDMEIISYVLEGGLAHRDSTGTGGDKGATILPGEIQRMSAGTGVVHSEFNASKVDPVHFLQIWLLPKQAGIRPSYEQKELPDLDGRLALIASPEGGDSTVRINSDARVYAGRFTAGQRAVHALADGRHAWVQIARGQARIGGEEVKAGDGVAVSGERQVEIEGIRDAELILFDLA